MKYNSYKYMMAVVAAFFFSGFLFAGYQFEIGDATGKQITTGSLRATKKDVDVTLSGRIKEDFITARNMYTMRSGISDELRFFRNKSYLDVKAQYGLQKYGASAADMKFRLTNYGYWNREWKYTPFSNDIMDLTNINGRAGLPGHNIQGDVRSMVMLTYLEEAWIKLHFGTFVDDFMEGFSLNDHPIDFQIGYFPYKLGRGVSYGGHPQNFPIVGMKARHRMNDTRYNPCGMLLHGAINKNITYDLYYSQKSFEATTREYMWRPVNRQRIDVDPNRRGIRGNSKDTYLVAARMDLKHKRDWGTLKAQPYGMYLDIPETSIEIVADSTARLGTVGLNLKYKRGGFKFDGEVAGQFGHQRVYAIDRNQTEEAVDIAGERYSQHSHIFIDGGDLGTKAPITGFLTGSTGVVYNGDRVKSDVPVAAGFSLNGTSTYGKYYEYHDVYNSNVTGNARFRDSYRIDYRGFMGMADVSYAFESVPFKAAAAFAYVSGDKYPFNTERNKRYKAFIPYGDHFYLGKEVESYIVLAAKKLPRPIDINWNTRYVINNRDDMSNLEFVGIGGTWNPLPNKKTLTIKSNLLSFWETITLKKWDRSASVPSDFIGWNDWNSGWTTNEDASRHLGVEWNIYIKYQPISAVAFKTYFSIFIPGQLFKDVEYQPNEMTRKGPLAAYGLGHDTAYYWAAALEYKF